MRLGRYLSCQETSGSTGEGNADDGPGLNRSVRERGRVPGLISASGDNVRALAFAVETVDTHVQVGGWVCVQCRKKAKGGMASIAITMTNHARELYEVISC